MRWTIHARAEFPALHALQSYNGKPEDLHEHQWRIAIRVGTDTLHPEGYALDFHAVDELLKRATQPLHGVDLGEHPEIGKMSPTAERLAEILARWLQQPLAEIGGTLLSVSVWEGPENRVDLTLGQESKTST
ncbi:MAG: 6-carboxytetrahydropterin synthase [bacterium]|nr:6-carboxytetrahydropterin synthase [bacterium]